MTELASNDVTVERVVCSREQAIELFRNMGEHFKVQIIEDLPEGEEISLYQQGAVDGSVPWSPRAEYRQAEKHSN